MSDQFTPTKEFPRQNQAPHEWPPQQGQGKGEDKTKRNITHEEAEQHSQMATKTAATSRNTTTTLAVDPHLVLGVEAHAAYEIEVHLVAICAIDGVDLKWAFLFPSDAVFAYLWLLDSETSALTLQYTQLSVTKSETITTNVMAGTAPEASFIRINAILKTGSTAGAAEFYWAQAVSDASPVTIQDGSYMTLRRVWA
jgi:hypothetical protein